MNRHKIETKINRDERVVAMLRMTSRATYSRSHRSLIALPQRLTFCTCLRSP